ncbi:MAG: Mut7-C RNAse domain-containing protein [Chloroflexia bacterium]|nr:Mut7-C RNAse domain-containing protein [Chloroflexia bacterium]
MSKPGYSDQQDRPEIARFLVDGMLGRLAKWLRAAGHDVVYEAPFDDLSLAERAGREERILLTRDRELASRKGLRSLLIQAQELDDQLCQVLALFPPPGIGARCMICNQTLEPVQLSAVQDFVPPHIRQTRKRFWICPSCRRVYWRGSHWQHIQERLRDCTEKASC